MNSVIWLLGLSGSGKSTLSEALSKAFTDKQIKNIILDGDLLRKGINNNLGFSLEDRIENVRRTAEVSKIFSNQNYVVIVALITPLEIMRRQNRQILGELYHEVFINTPLEVCKSRDPKGLYALVEQHKLNNFTGIDSPFEIPLSPNLVIDTVTKSVEENIQEILKYFNDICS